MNWGDAAVVVVGEGEVVVVVVVVEDDFGCELLMVAVVDEGEGDGEGDGEGEDAGDDGSNARLIDKIITIVPMLCMCSRRVAMGGPQEEFR